MFGLGPMEILILVGIIALVGGPSAVKMVFRSVRSLHQAKSQLTGKAVIGRLLDDDTPSKPKRKRKRKS